MPNQLVMIAGTAAQGKTASLMNMRNPKGVFYLGCEAGKSLPFPAEFKQIEGGLQHPEDVFEYFDAVEQMPEVHTIVVDSIDFLMEMFESQVVLPSKDTRKELAYQLL